MVSIDLTPAFSKNNVPVVFASDDKYIPYLSVVLASLKGHADIKSNYDIVVLSFNISEGNKNILHFMLASSPNFSLRFLRLRNFLKITSFFSTDTCPYLLIQGFLFRKFFRNIRKLFI